MRRAVAVLGICLSAGCILFVDDDPSKLHTTCASCGIAVNGDADGGATPGTDGGPIADAGTTTCNISGDSCFCEIGSGLGPNGMACNPSTLKGPGLCCASYGWPTATGTSCSCEPFSCTPNSSGAMCNLSTDSTGTTTWGGGGCCSYGTFCECAPGESCSTDPVAQCDVTTIGCDSSQIQVSSCSF